MVAKSFEVGDLVWAKMKRFPPWPGKIVDPPASVKSQKVKKSHHCVFFYGSDNYAWIPDENILLHNEKLVEEYATKKRPAVYLNAIDSIVNESKSSSKYQQQDESFEEHSSEDASPKYQKQESFEKHTSKASQKNKSPHSNNISKKRKVTVKVGKKRSLSPDHTEAENSGYSSSAKLSRLDEEYTSLMQNIPPNIGYNEDGTHGLLSRSNYVERPETPPLDLLRENTLLKTKDVNPTAKKIGFLGLGKLGQGIVKNLLQSGHFVTVWNRTTSKCDPFIKAGAQLSLTPADVVSCSDIIFCCVSDTDAAKALVFGNCGVLKGLENCNGVNKGYVEMTSMDPKTSQAIAEEVKLKGGRYLEAPLNGSRLQAIEGTMFILGAGDKSLFEDCKSCFLAIARHAMYISDKVGAASKFSIVHSMFIGTVYVALAESLALVNQFGFDGTDFLDILQYGVLDSTGIIDKGKAMINSDYTSNIPLKHVQKDINQAISLGTSVQQPLPLTAAANEIYKNLKRLRYSDHDVSAVYEGTKL